MVKVLEVDRTSEVEFGGYEAGKKYHRVDYFERKVGSSRRKRIT